jgi:hypothetical protein
MKRVNLIGQVFGKLTVVADAGANSRRQSLWECLCSCGNKSVVQGYSLVSGNTKSCGCFRFENGKTASLVHGHARFGQNTAEYRAWQHAKSRCLNPRVWNYENYGGRGIKMCKRWLNSFENFLADMGEKPKPKRKYSIDRINNDGHYEPNNCRWTTFSQQAYNRKRA